MLHFASVATARFTTSLAYTKEKSMTFADEGPPLSREFSLEAFFLELGLGNKMIVGPPIGKYGLDWGHVDREGELDEELLGRRSRECMLYSSTRDKDDDKGFGEVITPTFTTKDSTVFTFRYATYTDGMRIRTSIAKPDADPTHCEYTIAELRDMLGIPLE